MHRRPRSCTPSSRRSARWSPTSARTTSTSKTSATAGSRRLTNSQSPDEINGTFDWVYEEEFGLRDGFRWSPDGKSIAYWQLNTAGRPRVSRWSITPTRSIRGSHRSSIPRSANRMRPAGSASSRPTGGETHWLTDAGDPRQLHRVHGMGRQLQADRPPELNRLQNTAVCSSTSPETTGPHVIAAIRLTRRSLQSSHVATILTEHDDAWVDLQDELPWTRDDQEFLWLSERDGWRHIYRVDRTGKTPTLITPGDFDVIQLAGDRPEVGPGLLHRLARQRDAEVSLPRPPRRDRPRASDPQGSAGHARLPDLVRTRGWAVHRYSTFDTPPDDRTDPPAQPRARHDCSRTTRR